MNREMSRGAEQADGGADESELHAGREHEAGDVPGLGSERKADAELAGALGHRAGDDAVDAQGRPGRARGAPSAESTLPRTPSW